MKTGNIFRRVVLVMATTLLICSSCRKKEDPKPAPQPDTEQGTALDNYLADMIASDIESIGAQASEGAVLTTYKTSSGNNLLGAVCATLLVNVNDSTMTVDFGTNCLGQDGRVRSGRLVYDFSTSTGNGRYYRNPGFRMSVSAHNYVVDGYKVTINNKTVQNTTPVNLPAGPNPGTNLTWSISANISIVKPNNGGTITWICNRTKELANTSEEDCYRGQNMHILWTNAVIKLNGTASGTNSKGENYTAVATNLVRDFNCTPYAQNANRHPFISGTIVYTPGDRPARHIDYGNGVCDQSAMITINNVSYAFNLP